MFLVLAAGGEHRSGCLGKSNTCADAGAAALLGLGGLVLAVFFGLRR